MQIEITHPAFKINRLTVQTAGWFSWPKLLVNGSLAEKHKGRFTVVSDSGQETVIELKYNFLDPVPKVKVAGETLELVPSLRWFEYAWIGIPLLLVLIGGAIGGFVGAIGAAANGRVFRGAYSTPAKYGLSALIALGALITYVILAIAFHLLIGAPQR
jgi:hypothetical protein